LKTNRNHPELLCRAVSNQVGVRFHALAALPLRLKPRYIQNRKLEDPHSRYKNFKGKMKYNEPETSESVPHRL
jgi:hypothetical protein